MAEPSEQHSKPKPGQRLERFFRIVSSILFETQRMAIDVDEFSCCLHFVPRPHFHHSKGGNNIPIVHWILFSENCQALGAMKGLLFDGSNSAVNKKDEAMMKVDFGNQQLFSNLKLDFKFRLYV